MKLPLSTPDGLPYSPSAEGLVERSCHRNETCDTSKPIAVTDEGVSRSDASSRVPLPFGRRTPFTVPHIARQKEGFVMPLAGPLLLLLIPFAPLLWIVGAGAWAILGLDNLGVISLSEFGVFLQQIITSLEELGLFF